MAGGRKGGGKGGNAQWHDIDHGLLQYELDVLSRTAPQSPDGQSGWGLHPATSQGDDSPQARQLRRARRSAAAARSAEGSRVVAAGQPHWQQGGALGMERPLRQNQTPGGLAGMMPAQGRQAQGLTQNELDALAEENTTQTSGSPRSSDQVTPHMADLAVDFGGPRCGNTTPSTNPGLSQAQLDALSRIPMESQFPAGRGSAATYHNAPAYGVASPYNGAAPYNCAPPYNGAPPYQAAACYGGAAPRPPAAGGHDDGEPVSPQANQMRRAKRAVQYGSPSGQRA